MDAIKNLTAGMIKEDAPQVKIGQTVKVHVKIREGERERIQVFEGTVIARNNSGISETFTVRRVSYGVGVERVFPLHSPNVAKVEENAVILEIGPNRTKVPFEKWAIGSVTPKEAIQEKK